jgi:hypothetical protein
LFSYKYLIVSLGLSLIGLAVVVYFTYVPGSLERLQVKRLPGLIIALLVSGLRVYFSAARIYYLAEKSMSWLAAFRITLVWDFTSSVSPSTVGGAPAAPFAMNQEGINLGKSTALTIYGVFLDQLWFALAIPVLVICGFYFDVVPANVGFLGQGIMVAIYVFLISYASLLAYSLLINPAILHKVLLTIFSLPFLRKHKHIVELNVENLENAANELRQKPLSYTLVSFFFTVMSWMARIWLPVIVILSFGHADVLLSFLRSFAMNLAGFFMPTPGGSGGVEGLFAIFMGTMMPRKGYIGLAVFMWRFISYYISIGIGAFAVTWYMQGKAKSAQ